MGGRTVLSHEDVVLSSAGLVSLLEECAPNGEKERRVSDRVITAAADAGLFSMVVPHHRGGSGLGLDTLAQCTRILAHGCPATAWTLSFYAMHNWLLSRFPTAATDQVFAEKPWALAPAPLNPSGTAVPTAGGFKVTGKWEWATGVEHADWVMVHAVVESSGAFETRFLVLPRSDVEVRDVWHTSGMRATGSNTVVTKDRFVPIDRTVSKETLMDTSDAGSDWLLGGFPVVPVLALTAAAPALGAAEAAVEIFRKRLSERVLAYTLGEKQADQPAARVRYATALAEVRSARAVWEHALAEITEAVAVGTPTTEDRMAARLAAATTVRISRQAISTPMTSRSS